MNKMFLAKIRLDQKNLNVKFVNWPNIKGPLILPLTIDQQSHLRYFIVIYGVHCLVIA